MPTSNRIGPWRTRFTPDRETVDGTERLCRHCNAWSLLESFKLHPRCIGGRGFECRRCRRAKMNAWERAWYAKLTPEQKRARNQHARTGVRE